MFTDFFLLKRPWVAACVILPFLCFQNTEAKAFTGEMSASLNTTAGSSPTYILPGKLLSHQREAQEPLGHPFLCIVSVVSFESSLVFLCLSAYCIWPALDNIYFLYNFWLEWDRDMREVAKCSSRQYASTFIQHDLLRSIRDLDPGWHKVNVTKCPFGVKSIWIDPKNYPPANDSSVLTRTIVPGNGSILVWPYLEGQRLT